MTLRHWCGVAKYKAAKSSFVVGTVQAESDLEAERMLRAMLAEIIPLADADLEYLNPIQGLLAFQETT